MHETLKCYRKKKDENVEILEERQGKGVHKVRSVVLNTGCTFDLPWHWCPGHLTPFWFSWCEVGLSACYSNTSNSTEIGI